MRTKHPHKGHHRPRGFTAIEVLIAIGLMTAAAGITIPMYRQFQTQADLDTATEHLVQALRAAQVLSQAGKNDTGWGVYFPEGTLFAGSNYATRNPAHDASFTIPESVETSGLDETAFTKVDGLPVVTGTVVVTSLVSGDFRTITIDGYGVVSVSGIQRGMLPAGDSSGGSTGTAGSSGGSTGSTGGASGGTTSGSTGGTTGTSGGTTSGTTGSSGGSTGETSGAETGGTSSGTTGSSGGDTGGAGSSGVTTGSESGGGTTGSSGGSTGETGGGTTGGDGTSGGTGGSQCGLASFSVKGSDCAVTGQYSGAVYICADGAERTIEQDTCKSAADWQRDAEVFCANRCSGISCERRFVVKDGTVIGFGTNDVRLKVLGSDITYGAGGPKVAVKVSVSTDGGNEWTDLFGGKPVEGGEQQTVNNLSSGTPLVLRANGRYSWLFNKTFRSDAGDGHVYVLRNGDKPPAYAPFANQQSLEAFLRGILDGQGRISIGPRDIVFLFELGALNQSSADFQDTVILATFEEKPGTCSDDAGRPKVKVSFRRLQNIAGGNANNQVFVGPQRIVFAEEQWIPLTHSNGAIVIDGGLEENVQGLALERGNGWVRVLSHGSLPGSGKEIVDARVLFNKAIITSIENDVNQNKTENPTDGVVTDEADGDEFVNGPNAKSMVFKTRVTNADDAVILHWVLGEPSDDVSPASSTSSSSAPSVSLSDEDGGGDQCYVPYSVGSDGTVTLKRKADVTLRIAGSDSTYGLRGPRASVRAKISFDGGQIWQDLFSSKSLRGGELVTFRDVAVGSRILLQFNGRYSWVMNRTAQSGQGDSRVRVLRNNETFAGLQSILSRGEFKKYFGDLLDQNARTKGTRRETTVFIELGELGSADYHDAVAVISVDTPRSQGGCRSTADSAGTEQSTGSSSSAPESGTLDTDGDGIKNSADWCPIGTSMPESVPTEYMSFERFALTQPRGNGAALPIFREGPRRKVSQYTLVDTHGCSCSQILDAIEETGFHRFVDHPALYRKMKNLFSFYITNSRKFGCGEALMKLVTGRDE